MNIWPSGSLYSASLLQVSSGNIGYKQVRGLGSSSESFLGATSWVGVVEDIKEQW